jgi:hypothetical protein
MTGKPVQLSVTLPTGMHDRVRDVARQMRADTAQRVTLGDIYDAAIGALAARLDQGEDITFAAHPRGGVSRHSIRVDAATAAHTTRCLSQTTQSSFVATAIRHHLQKDIDHG